MAGMTVPDVVQANLVGTLFGAEVENTFYFTADGGYLPGDFTALGEWLAEWAGEDWAAGFSTALTFTRFELRELGDLEGLVNAFPITIDAEQNTSPGLPANVALAVARKSGLAGRKKNGRIYLCGFSENQVVDNTVQTAFVDDHVDMLNAMPTGLATAMSPFTPCIVSRLPSTPGGSTGSKVLIDHWQVTDYRVDTQRRRLS